MASFGEHSQTYRYFSILLYQLGNPPLRFNLAASACVILREGLEIFLFSDTAPHHTGCSSCYANIGTMYLHSLCNTVSVNCYFLSINIFLSKRVPFQYYHLHLKVPESLAKMTKGLSKCNFCTVHRGHWTKTV